MRTFASPLKNKATLTFFRSFFELLIGTDYVRKMIKEGKSAEEIKARWKDDVEKFKVQRKPYLLYEE